MTLQEAQEQLAAIILSQMSDSWGECFTPAYLQICCSGPPSRLSGRIGRQQLASLRAIVERSSAGDLTVESYEKGRGGRFHFRCKRVRGPLFAGKENQC